MKKDMRISRRLLLISAAAASTLVLALPGRAASCEDMANLKLPNTVIKSAQRFGLGEFNAPGRGKQPDFPAFCRVVASVKPAPDSDIGVEIWLPTDQWKSVFHGQWQWRICRFAER
jgi:feruloyl esterase